MLARGVCLALAAAPQVAVMDLAPGALEPALVKSQLAVWEKHEKTRWKGITRGQPDTQSQAEVLDRGHGAAIRDTGADGTGHDHGHPVGEGSATRQCSPVDAT